VTPVTWRNSCSADTKAALNVLVSMYKPVASVTVAQAKALIVALEKVAGSCGDDLTAFRIRYRIALLSFRVGLLDAAKAGFTALTADGKCPALVRVCSYNMVGQISRLAGEDTEALAAFDEAAKLAAEQLPTVEKDKGPFEEVLRAALFARGEIYELNGDYSASIGEYERLLGALSALADDKSLGGYKAMVNDRISQSYLRKGNVDKYIRAAQAIVSADTQYGRREIIELEMTCVKFLKGVNPNTVFGNGSFEAPAKVIAYVKQQEQTKAAADIVDKVGRLVDRYTQGYGAMMVEYHYAWLLDAIGEKDKAKKIFGRISSGEIEIQQCNEAIAGTVRQYAKIQYAIMLGEAGDYREALKALSQVAPAGEQTHISKLTESVSESIKILKREVPASENKQR